MVCVCLCQLVILVIFCDPIQLLKKHVLGCLLGWMDGKVCRQKHFSNDYAFIIHKEYLNS